MKHCRLNLSWFFIKLAMRIYPDMERIVFESCLKSFMERAKKKSDEAFKDLPKAIQDAFKQREKYLNELKS